MASSFLNLSRNSARKLHKELPETVLPASIPAVTPVIVILGMLD